MVHISSSPSSHGYSSSKGLPAKARIQPPSDGHMPNPNRPSNPFTPSPEPDWVNVPQMRANAGRPEPPPARGSQRARTVDFNGANTPGSSTTSLHQSTTPNLPARKLIVPAFPTHAAQTANFDGGRDALNDLQRSSSSASTRSLPVRPGAFSSQPPQSASRNSPQVLRKPAPPPIPNKKPSLLSKTSSQTVPTQTGQYRDEPDPLPPRRSMAERRPVQGSVMGTASLIDEEGAKPPLPPRTGSGGSIPGAVPGRGRNLMDDEPEEMGSLKGWEVLQPR